MRPSEFNKVARYICALVAALCLCGGPVAAAATVIYVDAAAGGAGSGSSWADAYTSVQDGLAAAAAADKPVEIRVAQGVYKPDQGAGITPGDRTATFQLLNGVTLKGGYAGAEPHDRNPEAHPTILSGDLASDDDSGTATMTENSRHVVTASGTDNTAVLDGFTITGGYRLTHGSDAGPSTRGGEAMLIDAGSPTILNCRFSRNYSTSAAGAVLAANGSNPVLTNCAFFDNEGTAMSLSDNSNAVLTDCRFEANRSEGLEIDRSSPVLTNCTFIHSGHRAIEARDCNSVLTNCVFQGGGDFEIVERGIYCGPGHLTLIDCMFTGLAWGAIFATGDLTLVRCAFQDNPGTHVGAVDCWGSLTALECVFSGNSGFAAGAISARDVELHDCEFTGNSGQLVGALDGGRDTLIATGCVFAGNTGDLAGAMRGHPEVVKLSNCTFIGNRGRSNTFDFWPTGPLPIRLTQCIVRDGPQPFGSNSWEIADINATYCDIEGGFEGQGNIDVDPCFVDPGYWDQNGMPDDPNDDFWVNGDYHLKSQGGHWDRTTESWVRDEVTSPCIDAGNPFNPLGVEPFPNGGVINIGAYGGTTEASKSYFGEPVCETQIPGDINGDCKVNQTDLDILQTHWLMEAAGLVNNPPVVTLLSPQDGAELTEPAPILFQATASDPDGTIVRIKYTLEHRHGTGRYTSSSTITHPTDNWEREWPWSSIRYDGKYTVWAEVMDNEGTKAASGKITITLHPAK